MAQYGVFDTILDKFERTYQYHRLKDFGTEYLDVKYVHLEFLGIYAEAHSWNGSEIVYDIDYVPPVVTPPVEINGSIDDSAPSGPDVIWSAEKILAEIAASGGSGIFGSELHFVESDSTTSTTSHSYQLKASITTSDLPSGVYRISWNYEWRGGDDKKQYSHRVQLNDSVTLMEDKIKPEHNKNNYFSDSGFTIKTMSGVNTIDLDRKASGNTSYIRRARIDIWRVS